MNVTNSKQSGVLRHRNVNSVLSVSGPGRTCLLKFVNLKTSHLAFHGLPQHANMPTLSLNTFRLGDNTTPTPMTVKVESLSLALAISTHNSSCKQST